MSDEPVANDLTATRWSRVLKWLAITLTTLVLLVALALGAFTLAMARMPAYRAQMQSWISERAKLDIQFAELSAGWRGYGPELVFTRAVVRSADQQRVLAIAERGAVGLDLWQALRTGRWVAARFALQGTELKVQRRSDGSFEVVGQADWPEFETEPTFKLDSLPVGTLSIRDVRLSFRDLKTGRGPWVVDQVEMDIIRDAQVFDVQGRARLPATLGKALAFSAHGAGNLNQVAQLEWRAEVSGTEIDLAGWTQVMPDDWIAPAQGQGSFQLAGKFIGGQPQAFSGRIDFVDVMMRLPVWSTPLPQADPLQVRADDPDATPLAVSNATVIKRNADAAAPALLYRNINLAFASQRNGQANKKASEQGWLTQFDRLQLARDNSPWPAGKASVLLQFNEADDALRLQRIEASADLIVLDNLWPLLAYLPDNNSNARLRALNATGRLYNLAVRYERDQDAEPRYGMRVEFAQLGVSPVGSTPGVTGLSGVFNATGARGQLQLESHDVALSLPRTFRTPLPLDHVTGLMSWTRTTQGMQLSSNDLSIDNTDGKVQAQLTLNIPRQGSTTIDMQAVGTDMNAAAAPRYMPAGVMHKKTLAWLDAAFPAGMVKRAQATLKGPLDKFPFRGNEGLFLINARIEDLTMNYQEGWMPATGLMIDAVFRNTGLSAVATAGHVNGLDLERAQGHINDYRDSEIFIKASTRGDLGNALVFVQQSPVGPSIGTLFQQLSGRGELRGTADMYFPLHDFSKHKVDIGVQLSDATVSMQGVTQTAEQLNGSLRILNDAVIAADLRGQFLRGEFAVTAKNVARNRFNVVADGQAQAAPLTEFLKLPAWLKLEGSARYRYTMPGYPQRESDGSRHLYSVDSDLRGLVINLPAPANKSATAARALHIDADLRGDDMLLRGSAGDLRAVVKLQAVNSPNTNQANVNQSAGAQASSWKFDRAGLRVDGVAVALPGQTGLRIEGRLEEFTLDDWLKLGNSSTTPATSASATRVQDVLRAANVNVGRLRLYGFEWPEVRGILQATDAGWRVDVAGAQASGQVLVPYDFATSKPLTLDMDVLKLSSVARTDHDQSEAAPRKQSLDPRDLPSLRADIKQFHYGEHDFGALQLLGTRTAQGLQVSKLQINGPSFSGTGSGSWVQTATGQQNTLTFTLESTDLRATMQQFNYADFIAAKRGKLLATLHWTDGLDEDLLGRASGTMEVQVDEGQLLNVQPGAGRVLGLLSVAALPRRLGLDFRDITDKGLAFDSIHADFTVQGGDARTQNLLLRGPTAEIGIAGRLGLGARDYDQTAVVTGDVGSALPMAGVMAGGPVVGAALLLFSQIFKEPLKGVARAYYHIGGSWEDPQVERIDADVGKASLSATEATP